jgi:ABC-type transport system involved in cytochrome c biogenesis permease subunit
MKTETLGIFAMLVPLMTYAFVSGGSIVTRGAFEIDLMIGGSRIPVNEAGTEFLRAQIPYVGELFRGAFIGSLLTVLCFAGYRRTGKAYLKTYGHWLARVLLLVQAVALAWLVYQMKVLATLADLIIPGQRSIIPPAWFQQFGARLELSFRGNPVGLASLFVALAVTAFIVVFAWRRDRFMEALPSLDVLDDLTYKGVTVAFPLLTLMTITGAVWANESWGRYWGWDPKETWALITCICYAIFLHTRIVHGWKGRRTALFAVVGFVAVIFTYLGVSFILPGLHSYATL